jgi:hypothetical protein
VHKLHREAVAKPRRRIHSESHSSIPEIVELFIPILHFDECDSATVLINVKFRDGLLLERELQACACRRAAGDSAK